MSATPPPETAAEQPPEKDKLASSGQAPKKKKKKRKKASTSSDATHTVDINSSKLSLKKRQLLKKSAKQTPWYDANELMSTGRGLLLALKLFPSPHSASDLYANGTTAAPDGLSDDEYSQLHAALRRVAIWRGRSDRGGRLPHAIDVTAGLSGILLMDAERSRDASVVNSISRPLHQAQIKSVSLYHLRNSYSTLLLRSVNGLADTYRHQKKSALLSVAHCCSLAGLPLWIVDVRHDASHNDLPSLAVCRIGALESLKFWKGRYWDVLHNKVWGVKQKPAERELLFDTANDIPEAGVHTLAVECLMRYQKAVEIEAAKRQRVLQNKKIKPEKKEYQRFHQWQQFSIQENSSKQFAEDDIMVLPEEDDGVSLNKADNNAKRQTVEDVKVVNPWWILEDKKPKKKKERKTIEADAANNDIATPSDDPNTAAAASPTSRECAAELIRTTPVDVLYSTVLQYLVWGGAAANSVTASNKAGYSGPALLDLPTNKNVRITQTLMEDAFEESRTSYEPLIVSIVCSYPGFLSALFVHLVDSLLCFDTESKRLRDESSNGSTELNEIEWNMHSLAMWTCYLLTREFQMHLDRSLAVTNRIASGKTNESLSESIDLKKKGRKKWTQWEQHFMQSPLPYDVLQGNNSIPLNSVCDRLLAYIGGKCTAPDEKNGDIVIKLYLYFHQILGNHRVFNCVSESHDKEAADDQSQSDVAPWTLCKSWDACAIGTMPGFPA